MKRRQMLLSAASMLSASAVHAQTPRLRRVAIAIPNAPDSSNEGIKAFNIGRNPMGRYGQAEEVARLVVFLASDSASYVNGAAWLIDGGRTAV